METVNFFDSQSQELNDMYRELLDTLKTCKYPSTNNGNENLSKIDKLQKLINLQEKLESNHYDCSAIKTKIKQFLNELHN